VPGVDEHGEPIGRKHRARVEWDAAIRLLVIGREFTNIQTVVISRGGAPAPTTKTASAE
jgi:hypothetical protein